MTIGVGASGFLGIAAEVTPGTYVAPAAYMLLRNESLHYIQETVWRRPLRGVADNVGGVAGNVRVEGDIEVEITEDTLPYLLKAARATLVKTGAGPYTYTYTPNHLATAATTISITVVRDGIVFGYVNCIVTMQRYTIDNGLLIGTFSIIGGDEAVQSLPTPTYVTTVPFGAGQYSIQIPTATQVFDTDTFTLEINDNGEAQYRLKNTGRGAQFVKWGERVVTLSLERDFQTRAEYDAFKALTAQSITILATKGATTQITFVLPAAVKDTYEITGLSGQADLIRANISNQGVYDPGTSQAYSIVVASTANIT